MTHFITDTNIFVTIYLFRDNIKEIGKQLTIVIHLFTLSARLIITKSF
jgi:hypothetical protein